MNSNLDVVKATNPILEIQLYLRDIAESNPSIPKIMPNGIYDTQTQNSASEFQRINNLPVTGEVDFATWNAIILEHNRATHIIKMPSNVCCFPGSIKEYKLGEEGNLICILQILLKSYNKKYKNYPDVKFTGVFDIQTESALKEFQKCSKLPITGILDRQTWNTLNKINEICKLYE